MFQSCSTSSAIQWIAGIVAFVAAALWLAAWWVKLPSIAATYSIKEEIDAFMKALRIQARLNGLAALFTAIAAMLQIVQSYAPVCAVLG